MIRFALKVGVASGAVYYIKEQGVWKDSNVTTQTLKNLKTSLRPYIQEVTSQIPFEVPNLPPTANISHLSKVYWNIGVVTTFEHLTKLPDYITSVIQKAVEAVMENVEVKNLVNTISGDDPTHKT